MGLFSKDNSAKKAAKKAEEAAAKAERENRRLERVRRQNIAAGRANVDGALSGFNQDYYDGLTKRYVENYVPQLDKQFRDAKGAVTRQLNDRGLIGSSVALDKSRDLSEDYTKTRSGIADAGVNTGIKARTDIDNSRQSLYSQVEAGLSPTDAAQRVATQVQSFSAPEEYQPLGDAFASVIGSLNTAVGAEARGFRGTGLNLYGRKSAGSAREVV